MVESVVQNQWASVSGQMVADAYYREADAFGAIAEQAIFQRMLPNFADYQAHLQRRNQDPAQQKKIRKLRPDAGTIDTAVPSPELVEIFCEAQVAVCCELFKGTSCTPAQMHREGMRLLAQQAARHVINTPAIADDISPADYSAAQQVLLEALNRIGNLDTIRVMQIARLLGLIVARSDTVRQLSLGAGNGYRDRYGIHAVPRITLQPQSAGGICRFDVVDREPVNTVLIDNDPMLARHYQRLNTEQGGRILAMNSAADQALEELGLIQQERSLGTRNLVAGLRIDHRMIPDATDFLQRIAGVIDQSADLLLTIGAGNNLAEFEGRLLCFDAISQSLKNRGMQPVRIKLHGQGTLQEQRRRPNFGNLEYASYQILYCKLLRNKF
ncbi:MAG: hypothetical protein O2971_01775 [Proteobacteria bacterium]|nr:hypothetical protein [Pseudomonadota bacterium]